MVDPTKITNYNLSQSELEEVVLFWVCAAGKNGVTAARALDKFLSFCDLSVSPFVKIKNIDQNFCLEELMKSAGIGCYNNKAKTFRALAYDQFDLKKCSVEDLESIPGIGPKTARCFLIHSRPNQNLAGLDTHVLKFLKDCGFQVPRATPTGKKYKNLENVFLQICKISKLSVSELDLKIWRVYSKRETNSQSVNFISSLKHKVQKKELVICRDL